MSTSRRTFFVQSITRVSTLSALIASGAARAQAPAAPAAVSETDPQAVALGYKTNGSTTDTKKYPNYVAAQSCSGCVLFQGKVTDSSASCAVFGNKMVSGKGWCSAWAKKV